MALNRHSFPKQSSIDLLAWLVVYNNILGFEQSYPNTTACVPTYLRVCTRICAHVLPCSVKNPWNGSGYLGGPHGVQFRHEQKWKTRKEDGKGNPGALSGPAITHATAGTPSQASLVRKQGVLARLTPFLLVIARISPVVRNDKNDIAIG